MSTSLEPLDLSALIPPIRTLMKEVSSVILKIYKQDFSIEDKSDNTPVTEADFAADRMLNAGLRELLPDVPVLSEESADIPFETRSTWTRYWLVDPLDGTREFINRNGEFTINIALIENHESILGAIHVPINNTLYTAYRGGGAWKESPKTPLTQIHTRKNQGEQWIVVGSRSHHSDEVTKFLDQIGEHRVLPVGSSLKSCMVAEGKADLYPRLGPTSEWDTAAAQCIVEEAGGMLTGTDLKPLRYNTKDSLLNPHFLVSGQPDQDWSRYL